MPYDFQDILQWVKTPEPSVPDWLHESWRDPVAFWSALDAFHASREPQPRSNLKDGFDFFHDLVLRHDTDEKRIAFRWYDRQAAGLQSLSYAELDKRSASLASDWSQHGVKRGESICLVLPLGPELVVSLIAALRLGLRLSLLPPLGPGYLARRLARLELHHAVARDVDQAKLQGVNSILRPEPGPEATQTPPPAPAIYKPDEPVALLFPAFDEPSSPPVMLRCDAAYLRAVRDGLLTLPLQPGDQLAAPGFPLLQHQPALLLITLLQGATFLHLEPEDLEHAPLLLQEHPVRHLGVSRPLRDALLRPECQLTLTDEGTWFRDPAEPLDTWWEPFIVKRQLRERKFPTFNLTLEAAAGGAVLLSTPRPGLIQAGVLPAAGRSWRLLDISSKGPSCELPDARGTVGLFAAKEDAQRPASFVLSRVGAEYFHAGTLEPRRAGRVYPSTEVRAALGDLPFVTDAAVVPVPADGMDHDFVLLVFTGAEEPEVTARSQDARGRDIRQRLEERLGVEFLPDRIEFFPLQARYERDAIDEAWCRMQYATGMLSLKSSQRAFQLITGLRQLVREPTVLFNPSNAPRHGVGS